MAVEDIEDLEKLNLEHSITGGIGTESRRREASESSSKSRSMEERQCHQQKENTGRRSALGRRAGRDQGE